MTQGELFEAGSRWSLAELTEYLNAGEPGPEQVAGPLADVVLTQNRVCMASVAFRGRGPARVRLHTAFLSAPEHVLTALRRYLRTRRREWWRAVADFARAIPAGDGRARRPPRAEARGAVHDLDGILRCVNRAHFSGRLSCGIAWGRSRPRRRRRGRSRSLRFGSWHADSRTIRIHRILDDRRVPAEFLSYLVFHEALHSVVPPVSLGHRREEHSATFRAIERGYPGWASMRRMESVLLQALLG